MMIRLNRLPRKFRIWWGKCFLKMLGTLGTHEFKDDIVLYNELKSWVDNNGKYEYQEIQNTEQQ